MIKKTSTFSFKIFVSVFLICSVLLSLSGWLSYSLLVKTIAQRVDENLSSTVNGIRQMVETSVHFAAKNYLRSLAEHHLDMARKYDHQVEAAGKNPDEVKKEFIDHLAAIKVGDNGYAYVIDSNGVVVYHPHDNFLGTDVSGENFIRKQLELKNGALEYEWKNPGETAAREKIIYMSYYEPWDWIISISAYLDELELLVEPGDYRQLVLSTGIGENGYPFIISTTGIFLIHPFFSGDIDQLPGNGRELLSEMIARGKGKIYYDQVEEEGEPSKEKVVIFETLESYGWIIAGTGYIADFYQPVIVVKKIFIGLLAAAFVFSTLLAYYLSRSITRPIKKLLQDLAIESEQFKFEHAESEGKNEIEAVTTYFYAYSRYIKEQHQKLLELYKKQNKDVLRLNLFKEVFDNIAEGLSVTDTKGNIEQINPAFERITGYSRKEVLGQNPRILKSGRHPEEFYEEMWNTLFDKGYWEGEIWNKRKDGEIYPEWLTISAIKNKRGDVVNYAAIFKDITELTRQKEKISFLAYHDHLTSLPNRLMVKERLHEAISECRRSQSRLICMVIDIEGFKSISDSIGQEMSDELLKLFVERLKPVVRVEDLFGRVGSDEFVLVTKAEHSYFEQIESIIERLYSTFIAPVQLEEHVFYITLSIGVAIFPDDGANEDNILSNAILALNNAEKIRGNSYCFYKHDMEDEVTNKIIFLAKIREGLNDNEFIPYYQPKVSLASGEITGIEALARWQSNEGLVSPAEFIPIAEESRLIIEMSWQLYRTVFYDCLMLINDGFTISASINISPYQLQLDSFFDDFLTIQQASGLESNHIDLEVTESALHENIRYVQNVLSQFKQAGFSLSIDDFGTGYSSLSYLKKLPFDTLKIDRSFISGIGNDQDDEHLIKVIVMLAKQFGMTIVSEGIETLEQIRFLKSLGCEQGQGFYYAKPMKFEKLRLLLEEGGTLDLPRQ